MMDMRLKLNKKYPRNAWDLYLKLYCERNSGTGKNKSIAAKSWLSLSESEKQQFYNKYKEEEIEQFANYLKKAEPFLKEKKHPVKRLQKFTTKEDQDTKKGHDTEINNSSCLKIESPTTEIQECENNDFTAHISNNEELNNIFKSPSLDTQDIQKSPTDNGQHENTIIPICEPVPPSLKSGKELFEMVKLMNGEKCDTWKSLPRIDKYQYNRAVLRLKKEYIKKYREFLESLSQRELFDYYNKIF